MACCRLKFDVKRKMHEVDVSCIGLSPQIVHSSGSIKQFLFIQSFWQKFLFLFHKSRDAQILELYITVGIQQNKIDVNSQYKTELEIFLEGSYP